MTVGSGLNVGLTGVEATGGLRLAVKAGALGVFAPFVMCWRV